MKNTNLQRRRNAIAKDLNNFVSDIIEKRSMKNIGQPRRRRRNVQEGATNNTKLLETILLNLIKVPKIILARANCLSRFQLQRNIFIQESIERLQFKNKIMTESTMWNYKKSNEI